MKTLVAIILALGIGFAGAYVVVTKQKNAEIAKLKSKPAAVPSKAPAAPAAPAEKTIVKTVTAAPAGESPSDILNDLISVKLGSGADRNNALRRVVFKLETLAQCGDSAVPAIRSFLGRNVDVDYNTPDSSNGGRFGGFRGGSRQARDLHNLGTDWIVPPSLRLGLVGVLKQIGGPAAEQALAEMLNSTGRGVEVAYLTVVLQEMAPDKYRDQAIKAAEYLLTNPVTINNPDRLDELSTSYLYGVLEFYDDTSFAINAQQMLVGKNGRLDQDAMDYLSTVMKKQSVSALYAAYNNPALTNRFDKMRLGRDLLGYVGQDQQADAVFNQTMDNTDLNPRMKMFTIAQLAGGGFGRMNNQMPTDPNIVNARITLLKQLQSQPQFASDQMLSQTIDATINALSSGKPVDMRQLFRGARGGRRGGN